ncbi:hypothetical protein [Pseudonocardia humida]|uniref:Uncharacterized protein n=1 Tax=Pseudonocardia humida TaxID=2800819 RepID=A0ABT1AC73_9PSEU|nr:hypothetical protein [Pseudonocardia humida]MCO1660637.1 hypothetical protein [Pseudonocardia humida]
MDGAGAGVRRAGRPGHPAGRGRPPLSRARLLLQLVGLFLLVGAGSAVAHGDVEGPPAASLPVLLGVEPAIGGLAVTVVEGGPRLRLDNGTDRTVEVLPPPDWGRAQEPLVQPGESAAWTDPRLAEPPAGAATSWEVPLLVGGEAVVVRGDRVWPPNPAPAPWWALTAAAALGTFCLGGTAALRRRDGEPGARTAELGVAAVAVVVVAAHVVHVLGAALVLSVPISAGAVLGAAGIGVVCWALGLTGAALVLARRPLGLAVCAAAGALAALLTAFDATGFHRAVLAFGWSFDLDRATTVVAFGGGLGLLVTGWAVLSHPREAAGQAEPADQPSS